MEERRLTDNQRNIIKKIVRTTLIICLIVILGFGMVYTANNWKKVYFDIKVTVFKSQNKKVEPNNVVFVGDSITDYCNLNKYYPDITAYNRGISADTTTGLLRRMNESIFDLKPQLVVFLMGVNDIVFYDRTPEEVINNVTIIIDMIYASNKETEIIIQSCYPINDIHYHKATDEKGEFVVEYNSLLKELAVEKDCAYVDIYSILVDSEENMAEDYSYDGLHPNDKGYELISQALNPIIMDIVRQNDQE